MPFSRCDSMKGRFAFRREGQDFILTSASRDEFRIGPEHRKYGWLTQVESGRVININARWTSARDYGGLYGLLQGEAGTLSFGEKGRQFRKARKASMRLTKREVLFRQFRKFTEVAGGVCRFAHLAPAGLR